MGLLSRVVTQQRVPLSVSLMRSCVAAPLSIREKREAAELIHCIVTLENGTKKEGGKEK